jgi:hypothetical protein
MIRPPPRGASPRRRVSSRVEAAMRISSGRVVAVVLVAALLDGPARAQIVLEAPVRSQAGTDPNQVIVGDLDEDGAPDVIASFPALAAPVLCLGNGDGSFGPSQTLAFLGTNATAQAFADVDGHLDLLVSTFFDVLVLPGDGDGGFLAGISLDPVGEAVGDAEFGDFNGDGHLDVIARWLPGTASYRVSLGHGDLSFDPPVEVGSSSSAFGMSAPMHTGDVNGDGYDDLVVRATGGFSVWRAQPRPGPWPGATITSGFFGGSPDFALAYLNADPYIDAVITDHVALGTAAGGFSSGVSVSTVNSKQVGAGDLDGDGHTDIVLDTGENSQGIKILRGAGNGTFPYPQLVVSHAGIVFDLTVADADGDGRQDIVAVGNPGWTTGTGSIATLLNHTYPAGSPFLDLGYALPGTFYNGWPIFLAEGSLLAGETATFRLVNGTPDGFAFLLFNTVQVNLPFKGGVMVPGPDAKAGPFVLDAQGDVTLSNPWPAGLSGIPFYFQFWMPNGNPQQFAATSAVRAQVP